MTLQRLPEIVYPLTQVNKVNEIVDVLNENLNMSYTEENPLLTSVEGSCTWVVTHNLGTENVNCSLYNGDMMVLSKIVTTSVNSVTVSLNSDTNIPAETYRIVVIANGAAASGGGGSYTLPVATTSTLGGVKIDGTSITIDDGVISSAGGVIDSTLSSTSTNPVQNKVITSALNDTKLYFVRGQLLSNYNGSLQGFGIANIVLYEHSKLAEIQVNIKVTSTDLSSQSFASGVDANLLNSLSSQQNVPAITPVSGGSWFMISTDGSVWRDYMGYGTIFTTNNTANYKYWQMSRMYQTDGTLGAYPAKEFQLHYILIGTCYGTFQ